MSRTGVKGPRASDVARWVAELASPEPSRLHLGGAALREAMAPRARARAALRSWGLDNQGAPVTTSATVSAPTFPRLVILHGGLLGRVTGTTPEGLPIVDRWHHGLAFTGWRSFGVEGRPLPAESPKRHPSYSAALARIGEVAS